MQDHAEDSQAERATITQSEAASAAAQHPLVQRQRAHPQHKPVSEQQQRGPVNAQDRHRDQAGGRGQSTQ